MKKLGVCVRYDCNNYGSMLQILATQKVIEQMGWAYELIHYNKKTFSFIVKNISRVSNIYFMSSKIRDFNKRQQLKRYPEIEKRNKERVQLFNDYRAKYIGPYSTEFKGYTNLAKGVSRYDAVMVGSDQLWTPAGIKSKFYNLLFVPSDIRRISFATSFGVSEIPENQIKETAKYLNRINYLSVREVAGAEIVKKLTGKDAVVALDPTLFLRGEEWEMMFPSQTMSDEPYIFAYFLGVDFKYREIVANLSKETGLKVITCPLMDGFLKEDISFGDEQRFNIDPVGFLNLIRGAQYVCTDSFHGSIFSILNHKQFVTFNRYEEGGKESRNSRIDSLFFLLNLQERRCSNNVKNVKELLDNVIDYAQVEMKLSVLREESFGFLKEALH